MSTTHTHPTSGAWAFVLPLAVAVLLFPSALGGRIGLGAASARADGPPVLIRSSAPAALSSHPSTHHRVEVDPVSGESSDWAADWAMPAGTPITPDLDGPYGTTLRVMDVQPACAGGVDGGSAVRVAVYQPGGGPRIGWVDYLHLSDDPIGRIGGSDIGSAPAPCP